MGRSNWIFGRIKLTIFGIKNQDQTFALAKKIRISRYFVQSVRTEWPDPSKRKNKQATDKWFCNFEEYKQCTAELNRS